MAELLFQVIDKTNLSNVWLDVKLHKRGDVLDVRPDGWGWSNIERSNPAWRILCWRQLSEEDAHQFLQPEMPKEPPVPGAPADPMLQARRYYLNLDDARLPELMKSWILDDSRADPTFNVPDSITVALLRLSRAQRVDPTIV